MRDHQPLVLEQFNGLWQRGDVEEAPMDHFTDVNNCQSYGPAAFQSRDGLGIHPDITSPHSHILRMYNYAMEDRNTILILVAGGSIYHIVDSTTTYGPILTIAGMTDFGFVAYNGRAYITPFTTTLVGGLNRERGLQNEHVYVYRGAGVAARKAGGNPPSVNITPAWGALGGHTDAGVHIFGYVYETDTGYQSAPGGLVAFTTAEDRFLDFTTIANSAETFVTKKHLVASKVIEDYNGDVNGYQLFFIPGATIPNNVTTVLSNIEFFDQDLLLDASHLIDNFTNIPAGVGLCIYHNRLCAWGEYDNISLVRVSFPGEPEAVSQIEGVLIMPPDGSPITNAAELRDILYVFKRNRTGSFVDNGDIPSSWPYSSVDNAMGCGVHGIATVLDSGASNIDYLLVGSYKGLILFNGRYILPELSWKVQDLWINQDFKTQSYRTQIVNDSYLSKFYVVLTNRRVLQADYANGFDPKNIKWWPWSFDVLVNCLALYNINDLLLGTDQV